MACRLVHKALTGSRARRSERVNRRLLNEAWEALEESWVEFDGIKRFSPGPNSTGEEMNRFADGWVRVVPPSSIATGHCYLSLTRCQ